MATNDNNDNDNNNNNDNQRRPLNKQWWKEK